VVLNVKIDNTGHMKERVGDIGENVN